MSVEIAKEWRLLLYALCFSAGVMYSATLERLLPNSLVVLFFVFVVVATAACYTLLARGSFVFRGLLLCVFATAGFGYGNFSNQLALAKQLPDSLDRQIFSVCGVVRDVIVGTASRQRFIFQVAHCKSASSALHGGSMLLLNWYEPDTAMTVGSYWRLNVRLKSPRGFVNPAGFDYQGWLLRKGFSATGTVKQALMVDVDDMFEDVVTATLIDHVRDDLRRWLDSQDIRHKGLFKALLIGDKSAITAAEWSLMRSTGTAHLMAISGLHIGLMAMLGYCVGAFWGRIANTLHAPITSPAFAHFCAGLSALSYAALAGFTTPTLRAVVMALAVQLCIMLCRVVHKRFAFSLALLIVVIIDPLAIWDAGFWLSFLAAMVLLLIFSGRYRDVSGGHQRTLNTLIQALRSQWYLFFGLLIPLLLFMQRATVLAPVANIIAIPVVSTLVVPLLALSVLLHSLPGVLAEWLAESLLYLSDNTFAALWQTLEAIDDLFLVDHIVPGGYGAGVWVSLSVAVILLLLPRGVPGRCLSYPVVLLPFVFVPGKTPDELRVTFLDVGQGTAVVVNVGERWLVYDTGPRFSGKFDAGSGIISPYLDANGARTIDRLIISHGDADHSGGGAALSQKHKVTKAYAPRELVECLNSGASTCLPQSWHSKPLEERIEAEQILPCETPDYWRWGKTTFSLFSARSEVQANGLAGRGHNPKSHKRNNRSCVLQIDHQGVSVLLTGDIEAIAERSLLAGGLLKGPVDWMTAPHHGSKTSSSDQFLSYLKPRNVVLQYGHNNSYHHPNHTVKHRYQMLGSNLEMTDISGAVQLIVDNQGKQSVVRWRHGHRRFWY